MIISKVDKPLIIEFQEKTLNIKKYYS